MLKATKKKLGSEPPSEEFGILANKAASNVNIDYALANIFNPNDFMTIVSNALEASLTIKALYYFAAAGDEVEFKAAHESVKKMLLTVAETVKICDNMIKEVIKKRGNKQDTRH